MLDNESVRTCITSPPYWGMRRYTGDPRELGNEETLEEYIEGMAELFEEVRRCLTKDGTLWLVLGDCYAGAPAGNARPDHSGLLLHGTRGGQKWTNGARTNAQRKFTVKPKDLVGVPWAVAFALRARGWYLRADVIWSKPNPLPDPVRDRPTRAHEYVFLLAKSERYFYDVDAIAEAATGKAPGNKTNKYTALYETGDERMRTKAGLPAVGAREKKNRRSVWEIPTAPFHGPHIAAMPPALALLCVRAGSAAGDTVLDPFCGSGTVGAAAVPHGRHFVGVDLDPQSVAMAKKRIAHPTWTGREPEEDPRQLQLFR